MLTVLLQSGKGGGMGAAFGGGNAATVFGGSGASSFLRRLTAGAATIFMLTSMILAFIASHNSGDALEKFGEQQQDLAKQKEDAKNGVPQRLRRRLGWFGGRFGIAFEDPDCSDRLGVRDRLDARTADAIGPTPSGSAATTAGFGATPSGSAAPPTGSAATPPSTPSGSAASSDNKSIAPSNKKPTSDKPAAPADKKPADAAAPPAANP